MHDGADRIQRVQRGNWNVKTWIAAVVGVALIVPAGVLVESGDPGVNSYVIKPVAFDGFVQVVRRLGLFWVLTNVAPE
jgi:hypothetical protein